MPQGHSRSLHDATRRAAVAAAAATAGGRASQVSCLNVTSEPGEITLGRRERRISLGICRVALNAIHIRRRPATHSDARAPSTSCPWIQSRLSGGVAPPAARRSSYAPEAIPAVHRRMTCLRARTSTRTESIWTVMASTTRSTKPYLDAYAHEPGVGCCGFRHCSARRCTLTFSSARLPVRPARTAAAAGASYSASRSRASR